MSRNSIAPILALLCCLAIPTAAFAQSVEQIAWLAGCWHLESSERGSIETWLPPAGGTLFGVSRTIKNGKTVAFEFMQIRALDDGKLAFIAKPSNQSEATFPLRRASENEIVFENLEHDFPQRISYRLVRKNELLARIEGTRDGKVRAIDYPMKRTSCERL